MVRLSMEIYPTSFTLEHIPKTLSPTGNITSAPKDFSVYVSVLASGGPEVPSSRPLLRSMASSVGTAEGQSGLSDGARGCESPDRKARVAASQRPWSPR